jgi:hypothetical protein
MRSAHTFGILPDRLAADANSSGARHLLALQSTHRHQTQNAAAEFHRHLLRLAIETRLQALQHGSGRDFIGLSRDDLVIAGPTKTDVNDFQAVLV